VVTTAHAVVIPPFVRKQKTPEIPSDPANTWSCGTLRTHSGGLAYVGIGRTVAVGSGFRACDPSRRCLVEQQSEWKRGFAA